MSLSKNLSAYSDVAAVLRTARDNGGALVDCADERAAIRWRARAYFYRSLIANSEYADLILRIEGSSVRIAFAAPVSIRALTGEPLALVPAADDEAMLAEAIRLLNETGN